MKFSLPIGEILFQEDGEGNIDFSRAELMRTGSFLHWGEKLDITTDKLKEVKKNFDDKVKKNDIAVDYSHFAFDKAAGWITEITLENKDTELWISVDWTPAAREQLSNKEYRYISADFNMNYTDNETGKAFGWVLNGAGLTNRPFVKGMDAILHDLDVSDNKRQAIKRILDDDEPEKKEEIMKFDEIMKAAKDANLSEDESKELAKELGVKLAEDVKAPKKEEKPEKDVKLSEEAKENKELKEKMALMEKEKEFDVLMSEGKACEAQKEHYLAGNMAEFAKLQADINLDAKGRGDGGKEGDGDETEAKTQEEAEDKIIELSGAKMKDDDKLAFTDANALVLSENPDLAKLCQAR